MAAISLRGDVTAIISNGTVTANSPVWQTLLQSHVNAWRYREAGRYLPDPDNQIAYELAQHFHGTVTFLDPAPDTVPGRVH